MNISLDLLKTFKTVAYHKSISKAAKELCVTQPSITKSIKKLESELKVSLFVREKKGVALTDTGKTLYRYIVDAINILDNTELIAQNINEQEVGKLRIGAGDSVTRHILKETITEYKKLHPRIQIEIHNRSSENLYNDLRYGRLDLIFVNSTICVNENKYKCNKLIEIEDCFFTIPSLYEKIKNTINLKSILSNALIVQNEKYDTRIFLNSICLKNNIQLKPTLEVDRHGLMVEFVKQGLGIGFATKQYIKDYLDTKELIEIKVNFNIDKRYINYIYKTENIKIKDFIKLLTHNINIKN